MINDKKQVILVVVPAVAVAFLIICTSIAIIRKLRRSSQRSLLPMTQKPPTSFTQNHLNTLRGWENPAATTPENGTWSSITTDSGHITLLAQPVASHQPQRLAKGAWQQFKEKQQQRATQTHAINKPLEKWHLQPKGPLYWREVGREMQARKTWWEKTKDRVGL
ncbi:hypothetical protein BDU57DRAFT_581586 [Ampelomyces quisqualis]|uniref:Uncharacterized protein n=1 Tax=Ampelomyces quisqualis TaxID=50730 RepID=A0A6A5QCN2_AMPQU|nr:hypothetical protein BDU57DRAFT_581586 [Ampelomyces quisqualis]